MKRLFAILMMLMFALSLNSCGKTYAENPLEVTSDQLVLYIAPGADYMMYAALEIYQKQYPEVNVEIKNFGRDWDAQGTADYLKILQTDLAAGSGPDLIVWDFEFADPFKTMASEVFDDLNPYLYYDNTFNMADYNEVVLNAGIYNGKQYVIPLGYYFPLLMTTKEILEEEGLSGDGTLSFDAYRESLQFYAEKHKVYPFTRDLGLLTLWPWLGQDFMDYEGGKVKKNVLHSDSFRKMMETYKSYHLYGGFDYRGEDTAQLQQKKTLWALNIFDIDGVVEIYSALSYENTPVMSTMKSSENKIIARAWQNTSIRANSKNKANAWNFLKILLSENIQAAEVGSPFGYPVLKSALLLQAEGTLDAWKETAYVDDVTGERIVHANMSDREIKNLVSLVSRVDSCTLDNSKLQSVRTGFMWDSMLPFFEDEKSYEQCLADLENKLELYIGE